MRKDTLAYHLSEVNKFANHIDSEKMTVRIPKNYNTLLLAERSVSLKFLKKIGYRISIVTE